MNLKKELSTNRPLQGEIFILGEVVFWSLFFVFSKIGILSLSPLFSLGLSSLFAALFFATVITFQKKWHQIKIRTAWKNILLATFFIGIVFYCLMFWGLQRTSADNGSIMALMEVFFSMVIFGLTKKEILNTRQKLGAFSMVLGALIILYRGNFQLNSGDLIILIATVFPPIGNYYAKKAMKEVGSLMIMFIRSLISGIFILFIAFLLEKTPTAFELGNSLFYIALNGLLVLGLSKVLWLEGISRIQITKAAALGAIAPAFTLLFAYLLLGEKPNYWQFLGFAPMLLGIFLLNEYKKNNEQV
ncbi:MAG: DMT family transporter [Candidatus Gracilibacteria bacterium]|jgi:drug/metabolite transporter (DMT)-like permease